MALHTELPIYRTGVRLLDLAVKAQVQMPPRPASAWLTTSAAWPRSRSAAIRAAIKLLKANGYRVTQPKEHA